MPVDEFGLDRPIQQPLGTEFAYPEPALAIVLDPSDQLFQIVQE